MSLVVINYFSDVSDVVLEFFCVAVAILWCNPLVCFIVL